jgi:hypothetical protein
MEKDRKAKEVPAVTKPVGKPGDERVRPAKSDYSKFSRELPFQGPSKGGYHNVGKKALKTPSEGKERVREGKVDYTKFTKEEPYKMPEHGGYKNVGKEAKATPSKGDERTDKVIKRKSPWRNA